MAITNISVRSTLTTTPQTVYTVPAAKEATVITCQAVNIVDDHTTVTLDNNGFTIARNIPLNIASAVGLLTGKLFLAAGDTITASAAIDNSANLIMAIYEVDV